DPDVEAGVLIKDGICKPSLWNKLPDMKSTYQIVNGSGIHIIITKLSPFCLIKPIPNLDKCQNLKF
ncbi:MAG: hypothetical protein K2I44_09355, partial [Muribaculaceae bacterium]|nr:hypothetical protein [Muribaculaceae bacterium]